MKVGQHLTQSRTSQVNCDRNKECTANHIYNILRTEMILQPNEHKVCLSEQREKKLNTSALIITETKAIKDASSF